MAALCKQSCKQILISVSLLFFATPNSANEGCPDGIKKRVRCLFTKPKTLFNILFYQPPFQPLVLHE